MININNISLLKSLNNIHSKNNNIQINTINAHSYNVAKKDSLFAQVLQESDFLLADGQSIVWAKKWLTGERLARIAGYDLFRWEMDRVNNLKGKCFFLGSTDETLQKIVNKISIEYQNITVKTYSPPYKQKFSGAENQAMISTVNDFEPDVLFVGMTAPKQEKWVYFNAKFLKTGHICSIGAVFDFYAGNIRRAPQQWQNLGMEWLYRLIKEPRRMWKRYIIGNTLFIYYILKEKFFDKND